MTQKEVIYNVRNLISSGRVSGWEKLSDRQLAFIIDYYRSFLIRNDVEKGRSINDVLLQTMDVNLAVDGCYWSTTIPTPIELHSTTTITYVGYKGTQYQPSTPNRIEFDKLSKFTGTNPRWFMDGNKLTVSNPLEKHNVKVKVRGLFERPIEVIIKNGQHNPQDEFNFHYPLSTNMLNQMYEMMVKNELRITVPTVEEAQVNE